MLLTYSNPVKPDFEFKPHAYSPDFSSSTAARYSPKLQSGPPLAQSTISSYRMGTPHRGLPPPSAMTLPDPGRGPPSMSSGLGQLPPAPSQWQGAEDGMRNWLAAKAEEERRKQEEERTRQESLRLEQRKVEQSMLRESMQGGIPPHLVPIIFAGIGSGNLANISAEWIQQYSPQVQAAQQQSQIQAQTHHSPDLRRDPRMASQQQPTIYAGQPQTPQTILPPTSVLPGQPLPAQPHNTVSGYTDSRAAQSTGFGGPPPSASHPPQSQLPRLTTNEMNIQQPPAAPLGVQQLQQTQSAQQEQSSPSIYFHHWVPPSSSQQEKSASGNTPATPSGKYKTSPVHQSRQRATSHASDLEYTSSPKKRKAQGPHQPAPPPTSAPQYTSPSFSHISSSSASTPGRRGHARGRSDASQRGPEAASGPLSRRSTVSGLAHETRPRQDEHAEGSRAALDGKARPDSDQAYTTSPHSRDERGQNYAPTSMGQHETSKYGSHQHWDRGQMSSPKREAGER
ncbi:hypothetical protein J1614_001584 [Plenodomus biglobosus]|nr:hypothetical protein J1614_001584 [Plenodomus biglobosus]